MGPFDRYDQGGKQLLGKPRTGDGSCRNGYGPPVFHQCGRHCVYCDRDLASTYESWLNISVDHVIPCSVGWYGDHPEWIEDTINLATCCRACNEFLNQFKCTEGVPTSLEEFTTLRDKVHSAKRIMAQRRHLQEKERYRVWHD